MQTELFMDEAGLDPDSPETARALRVVIAYHDVAAGKRAMRVLAGLARGMGDEVEFQPMPWSFDLLTEVDWRKVAASEAVNADILIIATSNTGPLPEAVGRWAEAAIQQKRGTAAAVVALFGPEGDHDGTGSSRLEAIQTAAQLAGLDFFAPAPRVELDASMARDFRPAGMAPSMFDEVLHLHSSHPASRWGINE